MKRITLVFGTLLAASTVTLAQFDPATKYDAGAVTAVVDRVHNDLNQAYRVWHFSDSDQDRLNHAEKELRQFASKWEHGNFDKGQLKGAIDAVQHVLDGNRMPPEDRNAISDDLSQLRRMREAYDRHEIEGAHH